MSIGALDIIIAADTAQLRKGMDTAVGIMQSSTQKMESFAKTAGASIAGYFALSNLRDSVQQSLDLADSLGKMSQKIGMSVDDLYSLQAAGQLSDVALQEIEKSVLKLNKNLGEMSMGGGKDAQNALKNLGISSKDVNGHIKDSNTVLLEVADRFKDMPNGAAKSTIAMQLFGKSGADLVPLLNGGSEAIKEFNGHMDKTTTDAAERFNDSFTRIGISIDGAKSKLLTSMVPSIDMLSGRIENLSEWISGNSDEIERFTDRAMNDFTALSQVGSQAFGLLGETSTVMVNIVSGAFDFMADEVLGSDDAMIDNFGFFEYFILGLSAATSGIGQFIANAKMAYATVAETHAKYGSITGLITNGGYDAAKARMDYQAASLEAQKYDKNVIDTYNTLIGLKNKLKSVNKPFEKQTFTTFDLEDFDKSKTGKSPKVTQAEKDAKELSAMEQRMFDERMNDAIKRFEEEIKAQEKLDHDIAQGQLSTISRRTIAHQDGVLKIEAAERALSMKMLDISGDWYTAESVRIGDQYNELEAAGVEKLRLQQFLSDSMAALDKEQIEKLKNDTIKLNTVFEDAFKSMEDSMVSMFMTGKFSAEDFFNTVIEGIIRMQIRNSITQPLTQAIGGVNFGEMFSGMFGNSSTTVNAVATSGAYNAWDGGMIPQYAIGGYTGDGGKYEPKGVVHGGEYVIPKWMVQKSPDLIGSLESTRKRGYADGGLVGSSLSGTSAPSMPVTINIENKSGTPISAESVTPQFDGKSMVINVVIDAITRNSGGMRDVVRSVR